VTERKWLTGADGLALATHWGTRFTDRKAHLLMLACCRRHPAHLKPDVLREAVRAIAAHFADPAAPDTPMDGEHFNDLYQRVDRSASARAKYPGRGIAFGVLAAVESASIAKQREETLRYLVHSCLYDIAHGFEAGVNTELAAQAVLVREILGNPFKRPKVKVKPAWRTDTVLALARQMYAAEEFSAMPILADALQDAGCDNDDILTHCRNVTQPHVRGCWVLDLLLEKV
jgi:hypothetical protein